MRKAELLTAQAGMDKVSVIAGVGVRNFYRKIGYEIAPGDGDFLIKTLPTVFRIRHHWAMTLLLRVLPVLIPVLIAMFMSGSSRSGNGLGSDLAS